MHSATSALLLRATARRETHHPCPRHHPRHAKRKNPHARATQPHVQPPSNDLAANGERRRLRCHQKIFSAPTTRRSAASHCGHRVRSRSAAMCSSAAPIILPTYTTSQSLSQRAWRLARQWKSAYARMQKPHTKFNQPSGEIIRPIERFRYSQTYTSHDCRLTCKMQHRVYQRKAVGLFCTRG